MLFRGALSVSEMSQVKVTRVLVWWSLCSALLPVGFLNTFIPVIKRALSSWLPSRPAGVTEGNPQNPSFCQFAPWKGNSSCFLFCLTQAPGTQLHGRGAGWICWGEGHTPGSNCQSQHHGTSCTHRHTQS